LSFLRRSMVYAAIRGEGWIPGSFPPPERQNSSFNNNDIAVAGSRSSHILSHEFTGLQSPSNDAPGQRLRRSSSHRAPRSLRGGRCTKIVVSEDAKVRIVSTSGVQYATPPRVGGGKITSAMEPHTVGEVCEIEGVLRVKPERLRTEWGCCPSTRSPSPIERRCTRSTNAPPFNRTSLRFRHGRRTDPVRASAQRSSAFPRSMPRRM
jgi:hypothetical protein